MNAKKVKFVLVFFIALVSGIAFTACSSDDETNGVFQTEADKELVKSLMNTKWVMTRMIRFDEIGQITYDSDEDEKWIQETVFLSSEKPSDAIHDYDHLCIWHVDGKPDLYEFWHVMDGVVFLSGGVVGKILSYTNSELIISTYKQDIWGDFYEKGATWYFKRVDADDE